jgi:hypothetical protein
VIDIISREVTMKHEGTRSIIKVFTDASRSRGQFFQKGGRRPQPIHGQPDAVLSGLHLKSLPKKQSFTKRRYQAKNLLIKVNNPFAFMGNFFIEKKVEKYI